MSLADGAAAFAVRAHAGQTRKGSDAPYITHPAGVAGRVALHYPDRDALIAAAWLHDVVEDTEVGLPAIEAAFGPAVARLVGGVTRGPGFRLEDHAGDIDIMRLKAADLSDNLEASIAVLAAGEDLFGRFAAGRRKLDYWRRVAAVVEGAIGDEPIATEMRELLTSLEAAAGE